VGCAAEAQEYGGGREVGLIEDVEKRNVMDGGFRLWWLGQSGFLLQWQGVHVLLDPYLSDSLTKKYAATDKAHVRMKPIVVAPEKLRFVDVVTSSHNHTDHLDAETLGALWGKPRMLIAEANRAFVAERLGIDAAVPVGLSDGETVELCGVRFTGVMSAHESPGPEFLGYVLEFGEWRVYHPGDTVLYEGLVEKLRPFAVDVALLPINGRGPERRVAGNFWGREAARLAFDIGARVAIPCHYDMFTFNTASPEEFVTSCEALEQGYRVLGGGDCYSVVKER
jgi:L-ascorbate metabolism protein UlaG (beta-lactamase superfamily)